MKAEGMTVAETARRLKVSIHHIYALLWGGQLEGKRVNGKWRVSPDAVEARRKQREEGSK